MKVTETAHWCLIFPVKTLKICFNLWKNSSVFHVSSRWVIGQYGEKWVVNLWYFPYVWKWFIGQIVRCWGSLIWLYIVFPCNPWNIRLRYSMIIWCRNTILNMARQKCSRKRQWRTSLPGKSDSGQTICAWKANISAHFLSFSVSACR